MFADCPAACLYHAIVYRLIIMSEKTITSRDNALVKHARAVRDGKFHEQIFIEGLRLCEEAQQALSVDDIKDVIYTERLLRFFAQP